MQGSHARSFEGIRDAARRQHHESGLRFVSFRRQRFQSSHLRRRKRTDNRRGAVIQLAGVYVVRAGVGKARLAVEAVRVERAARVALREAASSRNSSSRSKGRRGVKSAAKLWKAPTALWKRSEADMSCRSAANPAPHASEG